MYKQTYKRNSINFIELIHYQWLQDYQLKENKMKFAEAPVLIFSSKKYQNSMIFYEPIRIVKNQRFILKSFFVSFDVHLLLLAFLLQFCNKEMRSEEKVLKTVAFVLSILFLSTVVWQIQQLSVFKFQKNAHEEIQHKIEIFEQEKNRLLFDQFTMVRSSNIGKYCTTDAYTVTSEDLQLKNSNIETYSKIYTFDPDSIVKAAASMDTATLQEGFMGGTSIFVIVIGLVVLLLSWPFLLCCCCCTKACPPSECCRQSEKEPYTKCELYWPALTLIATLLLIAIGGMIGASQKNEPIFENVNCRVAVLLDNALNGNSTEDNSQYFVGIKLLEEGFRDLQNNLAFVKSQTDQLIDTGAGSTLGDFDADATTTLGHVAKIPSSSEAAMTLSYNTPLYESSSTATLSSQLATLVGTKTTSGSYTETLHTQISSVKTNMADLASKASTVSAAFANPAFNNNLTAEIGTLFDMNTDFGNYESKDFPDIADMLKSVDEAKVAYVITIYFLMIGLSVLSIIGVVVMMCFKKIACRYMLYGTCFLFFWIGLVCFLLSLVFSLMAPVIYYSCVYLEANIGSPSGFVKILDDTDVVDPTSNTYNAKECFKGTGDFTAFFDNDITAIGDLRSVLITIDNYNFTVNKTDITTNTDSYLASITEYGQGQKPDFDVTLGAAEITTAQSIANKSLYSGSCPSGTHTSFHADIWVPSVSAQYQNYVSCEGLSEQNSCTVTGCGAGTCLDTFTVIGSSGSTAQINTDLNSRYTPSCADFNADMQNFFTNYYTPVQTNIGDPSVTADLSDANKLIGRFTTATTSITNDLYAEMDTVKSKFDTLISNMNTQANSTLNPDTGAIVGSQCLLFGEDTEKVVEAFCTKSFNSIVGLIVPLTLISFGIVFSMFCTVCTGVRYLNQSQKSEEETKVKPQRVFEESTMSKNTIQVIPLSSNSRLY